jgi:hypothetical protein
MNYEKVGYLLSLYGMAREFWYEQYETAALFFALGLCIRIMRMKFDKQQGKIHDFISGGRVKDPRAGQNVDACP